MFDLVGPVRSGVQTPRITVVTDAAEGDDRRDRAPD